MFRRVYISNAFLVILVAMCGFGLNYEFAKGIRAIILDFNPVTVNYSKINLTLIYSLYSKYKGIF